LTLYDSSCCLSIGDVWENGRWGGIALPLAVRTEIGGKWARISAATGSGAILAANTDRYELMTISENYVMYRARVANVAVSPR
jgi:hypothetical protein